MVVASGLVLLMVLHVAFWMAMPFVVTGIVYLRERWRPVRPAAWAGLAGAGVGFGLAVLAVIFQILFLRFVLGPQQRNDEGPTGFTIGLFGLMATLGAGVPALVVLGYVSGFFMNRRRHRLKLPA